MDVTKSGPHEGSFPTLLVMVMILAFTFSGFSFVKKYVRPLQFRDENFSARRHGRPIIGIYMHTLSSVPTSPNSFALSCHFERIKKIFSKWCKQTLPWTDMDSCPSSFSLIVFPIVI